MHNYERRFLKRSRVTETSLAKNHVTGDESQEVGLRQFGRPLRS